MPDQDVPPAVRAALRSVPPPRCAYAYDTAVAAATATALRRAVPAATILYAIKANGHPDVVAALVAVLDGAEVASGGELALARAAGARRIAFGGPAKTDAELAAAIDAAAAGIAVTVNVESVTELRRLSARSAGATVRVALRINRAARAPAGSHRMTGVPTPFGIDEADLAEVAALARNLPGLDLAGFHLHAVSNNLDAAAHAAFVRDTLAWSARAATATGIRLREVNAGGGLGVDYTGGERFDLSALAGLRPPRGVDLVLEPGRYLAAGAGWYAAEVLDLKRTHGRWFAVLRGGTHHFRLPAAWGYSHPFVVVPVDEWRYGFARPEIRDVPVDAVGELCTPRDVLARDRRVSRLRIGDLLVFANAGAYGWDISHHDFLRHPYPQILIV